MSKQIKISKEQRKKGFLSGFKNFIMRGNVIDMAVGVIVGGAFGKIVTSLVNDIILPPIGVLLGGVEFRDLQALIHQKPVLDDNGAQVVIDGIAQFNNVYSLWEFNSNYFRILNYCVFYLYNLIYLYKT